MKLLIKLFSFIFLNSILFISLSSAITSVDSLQYNPFIGSALYAPVFPVGVELVGAIHPFNYTYYISRIILSNSAYDLGYITISGPDDTRTIKMRPYSSLTASQPGMLVGVLCPWEYGHCVLIKDFGGNDNGAVELDMFDIDFNFPPTTLFMDQYDQISYEGFFPLSLGLNYTLHYNRIEQRYSIFDPLSESSSLYTESIDYTNGYNAILGDGGTDHFYLAQSDFPDPVFPGQDFNTTVFLFSKTGSWTSEPTNIPVQTTLTVNLTCDGTCQYLDHIFNAFITVENTGTAVAEGVQVHFNGIPQGWTYIPSSNVVFIGDLPVGDKRIIKYTIERTNGAPATITAAAQSANSEDGLSNSIATLNQ